MWLLFGSMAVTLGFVVDSGAADVLIPNDVLLTLVRTGTVTEADFIGEQTYSLADGSKLTSARFNIRELKVGEHVVKNVTASVGPVASDPLLGQSFLSKVKAWTLDNTRHVLVLSEKSQVQQ
jgi:predicted aspartyl protease